jgi:hypothetical protein
VISFVQLEVTEICRFATSDAIPALQTRIIDVAATGYHDNFTCIYRG